MSPAVTVIVTVSVAIFPSGSVTFSSKTSTALFTSWVGAVKLALARLALDSVTDGVPVVCRQA